MKKFKKWLIASGLFGMMLTLSGCVQVIKSGPDAGKPTGDGWVYNLLVRPMSGIIDSLVQAFNGNYVLAVIILTVVVRAILFPLMVNQTKKSTYMSEKMAHLKPQIDAINAKVKAATTPEEQMAANKELQQLHKDHNINMFSSIGCLPLLIQMPIFTALFYSIKFASGVDKAAPFLGIDLSRPSWVLTIIVGLLYLGQAYLGTIGLDEAQKKQMRSMMFMTPIMMIMISFSSPAVVTIYWVVGGVISSLQTLYTNLVQKPKIRAQVEEEIRLNPPKPVEVKKVKEVKPNRPGQTGYTPMNQGKGNKLNTKPTKGLNAGRKQNIRK
ncbi:membrane protein insertase YidC [Vagococcus elongatus]|uniref:Membrane insertase YidC/Oxa/ALB C-terminal domain-containing protein n=1 Tax=Vagococcus elongatus TaxID=180344 RepID=A0A430AX79_9ENTE|nr:membrane protein insertase YidC [Vagococcus elongatus]RSU12672.1 hypothetical protein CBF29_05960 [Vagococcus elongatus]